MLPVIGIPFALMLFSGKTPTPPSSRPSLTPVNCKLTMQFIPDVDNRICPTPTSQADPRLVDGTATLASSHSHTYYCKITVEPVESPANYDPATYKTHWVTKGESMNIKVPKEVPSNLIIDFYENCNSCKSGTNGRPVFRGRAQLAPAQTHVHTALSYSMKAGC